MRLVCKFRGALVIAEVNLRPVDASDGRKSAGDLEGVSVVGNCPECGGSRFVDDGAWISCDCGFAYSSSGVRRLVSELPGASDRPAYQGYRLTGDEASIAFGQLAKRLIADRCDCECDSGYTCRRCWKLACRGVDVCDYNDELAHRYGRILERSRRIPG